MLIDELATPLVAREAQEKADDEEKMRYVGCHCPIKISRGSDEANRRQCQVCKVKVNMYCKTCLEAPPCALLRY